MSEKIVPKRVYFTVFILLLVLTLTTWQVALVNLGPLNTIAALLIAGCKAALVALFFMHVRWSHKLMRLVVVGSLLWLIILLALTMSDYMTRSWFRYPGNAPPPSAHLPFGGF